MDLTITLPVLNEAQNLAVLLRSLPRILRPLQISYEILVIDGGSKDNTVEVAQSFSEGVRVMFQIKKGYAEAIRLGAENARGKFMVTLDADLSHNPKLIQELWSHRAEKTMVIGSRYVPGGSADMPRIRFFLSRLLNFMAASFLSLPFKDISSGFRLYVTESLREIAIESRDFEIQEEILIKLLASGHRILEIPMHYRPRKRGTSKVHLFHFGQSFIKAFPKMIRIKNSIKQKISEGS